MLQVVLDSAISLSSQSGTSNQERHAVFIKRPLVHDFSRVFYEGAGKMVLHIIGKILLPLLLLSSCNEIYAIHRAAQGVEYNFQ